MKVPNKLNWSNLSSNINAIDLLRKKVKLEKKLSPQEYYDLKKNEEINWEKLSSNPNAIDLLYEERYSKRINWDALSGNTNPDAIKLLEVRMGHWVDIEIDDYLNINWIKISENPNAIKLIIKKIEKEDQYERESWKHLPVGNKNFLDRKKLSANPSIFTIN
jgi:hypothetical protein